MLDLDDANPTASRQAGFAMLECGMVKRNNVSNILLKNLADTNIVATVPLRAPTPEPHLSDLTFSSSW